MREILAARSDDDFVVAGPARRRSVNAPPAGTRQRIVRTILAHPKEVIAAIVVAGSAGAIIVNALAFQTVRHPAPLFGTRLHQSDGPAPLPPARPIAPMPIAPAPRAPARDLLSDPMRTGEVPPPPARTSSPTHPARQQAGRDPIGDLIRSSDLQAPAAGSSRSDPHRQVAAAQRALLKLGYTLKVDGLMGPGTRQAIERFERDHRLPVTGDLGPRTARELSAQAGMPVD